MSNGTVLYMFYVRSRDLICEVRVNDVLVYTHDGKTPETYAEKINPWLTTGENMVAVSLAMQAPITALRPSMPPHPGLNPMSPQPAAFSLTLKHGRQGVNPADSTVLLQYDWSAATAPLTDAGLTAVLRQPISVADLPYLAQWLHGDRTVIDQAGAREFVGWYANLLRSKAIGELLTANRLKVEELGKIFGVDVDQQLARMREYFTQLLQAKDFAVREAPHIAVVREGGGRLVRIDGPNGSPPIVVKSDGVDTPFPLLLAHIQNHWQIVR
jgi:hypothetical protein